MTRPLLASLTAARITVSLLVALGLAALGLALSLSLPAEKRALAEPLEEALALFFSGGTYTLLVFWGLRLGLRLTPARDAPSWGVLAGSVALCVGFATYSWWQDRSSRGDPSGMVGFTSERQVVMALPLLGLEALLRPLQRAAEARDSARFREQQRTELQRQALRADALIQSLATAEPLALGAFEELGFAASDGGTVFDALCDRGERTRLSGLEGQGDLRQLATQHLHRRVRELTPEQLEFVLELGGARDIIQFDHSTDSRGLLRALLTARRLELTRAYVAVAQRNGVGPHVFQSLLEIVLAFDVRDVPVEEVLEVLVDSGGKLSALSSFQFVSLRRGGHNVLHALAGQSARDFGDARPRQALGYLVLHHPESRQLLQDRDERGRTPLEVWLAACRNFNTCASDEARRLTALLTVSPAPKEAQLGDAPAR